MLMGQNGNMGPNLGPKKVILVHFGFRPLGTVGTYLNGKGFEAICAFGLIQNWKNER